MAKKSTAARRRRRPRRETLETLSANIREYRTLRRLSQDELAAAASLNRSYVGDLERCQHNPSLSTLECLADALGVSTVDLLAPASAAQRKRNS